MDLPVAAIDIPSGFDVLRAPNEIGGTIAVEPEQPHRAHSLTEVRAAMFHGGARPEGGWFGLRMVKVEEDKVNGTASSYFEFQLLLYIKRFSPLFIYTTLHLKLTNVWVKRHAE